jgi:glycosyltransferase involved in cell wall biosynthesis
MWVIYEQMSASKASKLKILISAYAFNPSGSLQLHPGEDLVGWNLVRQLNRRHDVWVITHSYNRDAVVEALSSGDMQDASIRFINLPRWMRLMYKIEFAQRIYYYLWQIKAWRVARRLHKQVHFDAAHHVTFGNDWIPSFIGAFLPVPFIWGPVGGGQRTPKPLKKEYTLEGKLSEFGREAAQWLGRHLWTRRRCVKRARAILVCNRETREKIPEKFRSKVTYFPVNGMSEEDVGPVPRKRGMTRPFKVMTAGRLHRLKGFALAVSAFHIFSQKNQRAEFEIVGEGNEHSALEKMIKEYGISGKVKISPWMKRDDLLKKMRRCDVFLFPSFRDGGGAVIIEAMAQGRPVVGLDVAGTGFHIDRKWGIKVKAGTPEQTAESLSQALDLLYRNEERRLKMGKAARKRVLDYYVWDRLGERMEKIYQEALLSQKSKIKNQK